MILRKYGNTVHSVEPNFDARAMNEIGFRKNDEWSIPTNEFEQGYTRVAGHELIAQADGDVQHEAETQVLQQLEEQVRKLESALGQGEVLFVESEMGKDYPKMRETVSNIVVGNENRLRFNRTVDPPLRIAVYAPRKS